MSFIVKPLGATLAEDHDLLGKSDPYCVCIVGKQKAQTKPHSGGGNAPKWTDALKFESQDHEMKVEVYDDDIGKDDFHGAGVLDLSNFLANPGKAMTVNVEINNQKKKKSGQVSIQVEYQGPAVNNIGSLNHASKLGY